MQGQDDHFVGADDLGAGAGGMVRLRPAPQLIGTNQEQTLETGAIALRADRRVFECECVCMHKINDGPQRHSDPPTRDNLTNNRTRALSV